jgi:hypothetical protein
VVPQGWGLDGALNLRNRNRGLFAGIKGQKRVELTWCCFVLQADYMLPPTSSSSQPGYETIYEVQSDGTRAEAAFRCGACGMRTRFRQSIQRHVRDKHSGVRHVCGACGAAYSWKISLARHRKTCTGLPLSAGVLGAIGAASGGSGAGAIGQVSQIARIQLAQLDAANNSFPSPQNLAPSPQSFASQPMTQPLTSQPIFPGFSPPALPSDSQSPLPTSPTALSRQPGMHSPPDLCHNEEDDGDGDGDGPPALPMEPPAPSPSDFSPMPPEIIKVEGNYAAAVSTSSAQN